MNTLEAVLAGRAAAQHQQARQGCLVNRWHIKASDPSREQEVFTFSVSTNRLRKSAAVMAPPKRPPPTFFMSAGQQTIRHRRVHCLDPLTALVMSERSCLRRVRRRVMHLSFKLACECHYVHMAARSLAALSTLRMAVTAPHHRMQAV